MEADHELFSHPFLRWALVITVLAMVMTSGAVGGSMFLFVLCAAFVLSALFIELMEERFTLVLEQNIALNEQNVAMDKKLDEMIRHQRKFAGLYDAWALQQEDAAWRSSETQELVAYDR